jgi:UDP-N-acetyl-D-glucosamine dehydrogenase
MNQIENLLNKIENKQFTIGIIGLGYVGLPLMWTFHEKGMPVLGFDVDQKKVDCIKEGVPYIKHLGDEMMQVLSQSDICDATTDSSRMSEADALLLCVPTPLDHHREPDMKYVHQTTETVAKQLRKGQLVVLESTTWPGTTEELMIPILEKRSGLKAGKDFMWLIALNGKIPEMRILIQPRYQKWSADTVMTHSNLPVLCMIPPSYRPCR